MKFLHLSDLHLGKRLNEYSLIPDQEHILKQIIDIIYSEMPDGVLIAGDVYDKSVPSAEAIGLFDDFLTRLSIKGIPVYIISGNHDSAERMSFGHKLMSPSGIHIAGAYDGVTQYHTLTDEGGEVRIYLLPFIKPPIARRFHDGDIESYNDAMREVIVAMNIDTSVRNILVTHQLVTGSQRSDSEEISVGGTDDIALSVFDDFDYVALGHLHRPQNCTTDRVRYCGSPLKYSFSESSDVKSVTIIDLPEKGSLKIKTIPLTPIHDMVEIRGKYEEIMQKSFYEGTTYCTDYLHITLTDEDEVLDAIGRLRTVYRNLMKLDYDNQRTRSLGGAMEMPVEKRGPMELFSDFYTAQNGKAMSDEQADFVRGLIEGIWEGEI